MASVSKAGGFGFVGGGYWTPAQATDELKLAEDVIGRSADGRLDVGIGFLAWTLSKLDEGGFTTVQQALDRPKAIEYIDAALRTKPRALWLAFGSPTELAGWAEVLRLREKASKEREEVPWKLFVGVGSEEEARHAVEMVGADVVVAQGPSFRSSLVLDHTFSTESSLSFPGIEAGGHGNRSSPPLSTLLPVIAKSLPTYKPLFPSTRPLLLGAGGLSTGSHLTSLLSLGADGAVFGTRFLATEESLFGPLQKQVVIGASAEDSVRSMAFDEARNTLDWPEGVDGRGVWNSTVEEYDKGLGDKASRQRRYNEAVEEADADRLIVWAGTGVGESRKIDKAEDVVRALEREAVEAALRVRDSFAKDS